MDHHDFTWTSLTLGKHAVHVPGWLCVQQAGDGIVSFVGASRLAEAEPHPLRFGNGRTHQIIVGELIVRPHWALGTDALRGEGLGGLATNLHGGPDSLSRYLQQGELILDPYQRFPGARD